MKILSLSLENFMPYKGSHSIDFRTSSNSQVVLFLGKNGHGKSSLLHAIRWCLYGSTSVRKIRKNNDSLMNRDVIDEAKLDSNVKMSVTLVWENQGSEYELTRRWWFDAVSNSPSSSVLMRIDGGNPISESQIQVLVNQFLPLEMSHLFLFDGESQKEFDDMASDGAAANFIRGEIESTLSIPSLNSYKEALQQKTNLEQKNASQSQKNDARFEKLAAEVDQLRINLSDSRENTKKLREEIDARRYEMQAAEDLLGDVEKFQELVGRRATWEASEKAAIDQRELLLEDLRSRVQANFWLPAAKKIATVSLENQAKAGAQTKLSEEKYRVLAKIEQQKSRLDSKNCPTCGHETVIDVDSINQEIEKLSKALLEIESHISNEPDSVGPSLLRIGYSSNTTAGIESKVQKLVEANAMVSRARVEVAKIKNLIDSFDVDGVNSLEALDNFKLADKLHDRAKSMFNQSSEKEQELLLTLNAKQSELNKLTRTSPERQMILDSLSQVNSILGVAIEKYIDQARKSVERYATETFVGILGNHKWSGLEIDVNFGATPMLTKGSSDEMANTGTQKVTAISLVDGLIRTSMDGGFVLMDSPTGSLDDDNRDNFFKWAAKSKMQVCLFMHDGEYDDKKHRASFGGRVGRVFEITLLTENQSIVSAVKEIE